MECTEINHHLHRAVWPQLAASFALLSKIVASPANFHGLFQPLRYAVGANKDMQDLIQASTEHSFLSSYCLQTPG